VWGIGCVLYELCFLRKAFYGENIFDINDDIVKKNPDFNNFRYSKEL
jgi:hypothetical protein